MFEMNSKPEADQSPNSAVRDSGRMFKVSGDCRFDWEGDTRGIHAG